ncbi:MAG: glycosyltransferase family 4 protein [Chitinispirillaceae bacterium]|nr:glycosyltransferase family 4 protein [Chitinispirillaceae bacterium]
MKILQIVHFYPPIAFGGTEIYTQSLVEELGKNNRVLVLCTENPVQGVTAANVSLKPVGNIELRILPSRMPTVFRDTYDDRSLDSRLAGIIKEFSPDIVHLQHLLFHSISFIDVVVAAGIPFIMTLHDYWYICPQCFLTRQDGSLCGGPGTGDVCLACDSADGNRYLTLANAVSPNSSIKAVFECIKPVFPRIFRQWAWRMVIENKNNYARSVRGFTETKLRLMQTVAALNKAALIIAPSGLLAERYAKAGVNNIRVIPHGIKAPANGTFSNEKYRKRPRHVITFGYIGGIIPYKGVHVLIEAFNRLNPGGASLLIYGQSGVDAAYDKILAGSAAHPDIRFMGFFEHKDIFEVLGEIDVIVIPSLCAENYPLVVNEAFMVKTPVIASNVGGLNRLVHDGMTGFLFEKGDAHQLAGIMHRIVQSPGILENLSKNIPPVKAMKQHAWEIEKLYRQAIALKAGKTPGA